MFCLNNNPITFLWYSFMESTRVSLLLLVMRDMEPEPGIFWNQTRCHVEGLRHQQTYKTFTLQFVLSAEWSRTGA